MKKERIIPIRIIPEYHDTDFDGVPNFRDCNPWNPHEQGKYVEVITDEKGNLVQTKQLSRRELLDFHSLAIFKVPYSGLDSKQKRQLKIIIRQSFR